MSGINVKWTPICGHHDKDESIQRFLNESVKSPSPSNPTPPDKKLRVDYAGNSDAAKNKGGWNARNAKLSPSAAGAAGPSGSAASSSNQGSAAAASSQHDSPRNTSGGAAPPAQSSMPPPETNRIDCAGADQSLDNGSGANHAAAAQDGSGATASPRGPVQSAHSLNHRPRDSHTIRQLQEALEEAKAKAEAAGAAAQDLRSNLENAHEIIQTQDASLNQTRKSANMHRMRYVRLVENDCVIMGGKRWLFTSLTETDSIGEASKGDEGGAGDEASGPQGKKRRAKRQRVFANNAAVAAFKANIEVREGNAGGWSYSQREKVFSYGLHVHAGQARLGLGNWFVEKDTLRRATGVAFTNGRKGLLSNVRSFPV